MYADTNQDAYLNQIMLKIPKPQSVKQNMLPKKKQFVLKSDKIILISDHYGMPVCVVKETCYLLLINWHAKWALVDTKSVWSITNEYTVSGDVWSMFAEVFDWWHSSWQFTFQSSNQQQTTIISGVLYWSSKNIFLSKSCR